MGNVCQSCRLTWSKGGVTRWPEFYDEGSRWDDLAAHVQAHTDLLKCLANATRR